MGLTLGTVKQKAHKIYDKLEAANRTEALNTYRQTMQKEPSDVLERDGLKNTALD